MENQSPAHHHGSIWVEDSFPFELLPGIKELNLGGVGLEGYGCRGGGGLLAGLVAMEMGRIDASIRHSLVCTAVWQCLPSTTVDRKSKNRSGFHRWLAWRRSDASV